MKFNLYPIFGPEMHIRGSNIFPGSVTSLLRMCTMEIFFICYFYDIFHHSDVRTEFIHSYGGQSRSILMFYMILYVSI